jgi:hypothetical protein
MLDCPTASPASATSAVHKIASDKSAAIHILAPDIE